jgi:GT2 family glycosyltransferase
MPHAVVMIVYNNLEMTKEAVASVFAQDIGPIELWIVDNGSTDGTGEWLGGFMPDAHHTIYKKWNAVNESPVKLSNRLCEAIFDSGHTKLLGVPNDVILPTNLYREFNRWPRGIVTGSMTEDRNFPRFTSASAVNTCTPLCVAMIRRWAYDGMVAKDGYLYDENFFNYASDMDFALRLASCGIVGVQLDIQYWHYRSASHRLASREVGDAMRAQADVDRSYFFRKWGFGVTDPRYTGTAADINFRGERIG